MLRIIRTTTLQALNAERDELHDKVRQADTTAKAANDSAVRAESAAEGLLTQLGQAHADTIAAERRAGELCTELVQAQRKVEDTSGVLTEIRADLDQLRADVADPERGESRRAALAYGVLQRLHEEARSEGRTLGRPWDLLAFVLGFPDADPANSVPVSAPAEVQGGAV